jgi:hypothetical protein
MNPPPDPRDREAWHQWHAEFNASYDREARHGRRRWLTRVAGVSLVLTTSAGGLLALTLHWLSQ